MAVQLLMRAACSPSEKHMHHGRFSSAAAADFLAKRDSAQKDRAALHYLSYSRMCVCNKSQMNLYPGRDERESKMRIDVLLQSGRARGMKFSSSCSRNLTLAKAIPGLP
jgi:hypothetical protein